MNFRRLPFQFTTTDPAERTRELERRFGLPSNRDMYVDAATPLSMGAVSRESNMSASSPRLQHRVPIFVDGYDQPIHSSVDSTAPTSENKKPNVRVIPIKVEGADNRSVRHRTFSEPAQTAYEQDHKCPSQVNVSSPLKRSVEDFSTVNAAISGPKIHTIPIKVESSNKSTKIPKFEKSAKLSPANFNGCTVSKLPASSKSSVEANKPEEHNAKIGIANSLEKIKSVLEQLKIYETGVQEFNGTTKDKQYRYLDEMLTQCMIKLDDVDTMGNDSVRLARKNAVKNIQAQLDLLESKANAGVSPESSTAKTSKIQELALAPKTEEIATVNETKRAESRNDVEMESGESPVEAEVPLGGIEDKFPMCQNSNPVTSEVEMEVTWPNGRRDNIKTVASDHLVSADTGELASAKVIKRGESQNDVEMVSVGSQGDETECDEVSPSGMEDKASMCLDFNSVTSEEVEMEATQPNSGRNCVETVASDKLVSSKAICKIPPNYKFSESDSTSSLHEIMSGQILSATQEDIDMKNVQNVMFKDQGEAKEDNSSPSQPKDSCESSVIMEKTASSNSVTETSNCNDDIVPSECHRDIIETVSELCNMSGSIKKNSTY